MSTTPVRRGGIASHLVLVMFLWRSSCSRDFASPMSSSVMACGSCWRAFGPVLPFSRSRTCLMHVAVHASVAVGRARVRRHPGGECAAAFVYVRRRAHQRAGESMAIPHAGLSRRPPNFAVRLAGLSCESPRSLQRRKKLPAKRSTSAFRKLVSSTAGASSWPAGPFGGRIRVDYCDPLGNVLPARIRDAGPIASAGRITHVLLDLARPARPGLVTHDLDFLRTIATQCGNRLDALHREERSHRAPEPRIASCSSRSPRLNYAPCARRSIRISCSIR